MKYITLLGGTLLVWASASASGEQLLYDGITGAPAAAHASSWRDPRTASGTLQGGSIGVLITTNTPFTLTRVEALVTLDDPAFIPDTDFQFVVFRGTNKFRWSMFEEPEFRASFSASDTNMSLTPVDGTNWLLSLTLPPYAWGTSRVLAIRTEPGSDQPFVHLKLVSGAASVPGITAFAADLDGKVWQTNTPAIRVWRTLLPSRGEISYLHSGDEMELSVGPGYQLGQSSELYGEPIWLSDAAGFWKSVVGIPREGKGYFFSRPDSAP